MVHDFKKLEMKLILNQIVSYHVFYNNFAVSVEIIDLLHWRPIFICFNLKNQLMSQIYLLINISRYKIYDMDI